MFFKSTPLKKARKSAEDWLQLAHKIYHYRRDLLSTERLTALTEAIETLSRCASKKSGATLEEVVTATTQLEAILKNCGGQFYPRKFLTENVEMILVAAILALGIRAYFVQPFKIPTNSMYPTYYGMTHVVDDDASSKPNALERIYRMAMMTTTKQVIAEDDGRLIIPLQPTVVNGRKYLLLQAKMLNYTFLIGNKPVDLVVPADFSGMSEIIMEKWGQDREHWTKKMVDGIGPCIVTNKEYKKGDVVLSFQILTGDALFVDRISYHFIRPEVGDPFVFPTDNVPGLRDKGKYYIKRIVGQGGDTLEIKQPVLYRNGSPITGAEAFDLNATTSGKYEGYINAERINGTHLMKGEALKIPVGTYFAMGDNSDQSSDSRVWGFVPEKEVIGRAIFIYYPFTDRWGISK
ncbi:MAG: signal peptidase I [Verrucomicrobiota bacterium]|nr:signal peptidase I [Verrucomicrobiota bacterium]